MGCRGVVDIHARHPMTAEILQYRLLLRPILRCYIVSNSGDLVPTRSLLGSQCLDTGVLLMVIHKLQIVAMDPTLASASGGDRGGSRNRLKPHATPKRIPRKPSPLSFTGLRLWGPSLGGVLSTEPVYGSTVSVFRRPSLVLDPYVINIWPDGLPLVPGHHHLFLHQKESRAEGGDVRRNVGEKTRHPGRRGRKKGVDGGVARGDGETLSNDLYIESKKGKKKGEKQLRDALL